MRSYEEMAQRVLTRGEAIREQQQKRRKILLGTASGLIVCGLAALLVLGIWNKQPDLPAPDTPPQVDTPDVILPKVRVLSQRGQYETIELSARKLMWNQEEILLFAAAYEGELHFQCEIENHILKPIYGSDRFLCLRTQEAYSYLVDTQTGEVLDPLAALEQEARDTLTDISFSPDGNYALISYGEGKVLELLEIKTGSRTKLPCEENMFSVSGRFLDEKTVLISSARREYQAGGSCNLSRYDITTGECKALLDIVVYEDFYIDSFFVMIGGPYAYTYTYGKFTLVDMRTMERTIYSLNVGEVTGVAYHTGESIRVTSGEVQYLLKTNKEM